MLDAYDIVIVGNGIAGFSAATAARAQAPERSVLLIGEEDRLPYKRTKLSKSIAAGFSRDAFLLEPEAWYREHNIDLMVGCRVMRVDADGHSLVLGDGRMLGWSGLVLATGASPIRPSFLRGDVSGVYVIRSAKQTERLEEALREVEAVCVVGMGVLGVEVAAEILTMGKHVTLVGDCDRLMPRHLNGTAATMLRAEFDARGTALVFNGRVEGVTGGERRALGVRLRDRVLEVDLCVFCLGVAPNMDLARDAHLQTGRGIVVDDRLRTSHPCIYAAGDAAEHPDGQVTGLWHAAEHQGWVAGTNAAGGDEVDDRLPYRLKCEVFGRYFFSINKPPDDDVTELTVVESVNGSGYRCLYFRDGRLRGVVMVDEPDQAKRYEQAVREEWPRGKVLT
jgi:NAD(P)H-nitrite reductase large subunit